MCGIFGIAVSETSKISAGQLKGATSHLLRLSESRGKEASGIALASHDSISVLKRPYSASRLIRSADYAGVFDGLDRDTPSPRGITVVGHSRLVTNGGRERHENNQPVIDHGIVGIHNGIIVNVDSLFSETPGLTRDFEVDSEVILDLVGLKRSQGFDLISAVQMAFSEIEGVASVALLFSNEASLVLATNNGSLYYCATPESLVFASERVILQKFIGKNPLGAGNISHVRAGKGLFVNTKTLRSTPFDLEGEKAPRQVVPDEIAGRIVDIPDAPADLRGEPASVSAPRDKERGLVEYAESFIASQRRCSRCLLPTTFPYIAYDAAGVCNYCEAYQPIQLLGEAKLREELAGLEGTPDSPQCVVALSGGRDSCYILHYLKRVLGIHPIAYTYDWGMVTDLARRNMSRMCAELGIEHVLVSADITTKRENIRKNVSAWLKKPHLGAVPLFMAGDKQFFYYANKVMKENNARKLIFGMNLLERTDFKVGFCGVEKLKRKEEYYRLLLADQVRMLSFYAKQFLTNPGYLNSSLLDSAFAFASYYSIPHDHLLFFRYLPWNENEIVSTLVKEYDWEVATDTTSTWRIGDGTASFYNYIYVTVAGFSEGDTFRSNQIREGLITREQGMQLLLEENRPRVESIRWYCETVGLDFGETLRAINDIPKLWQAPHKKS